VRPALANIITARVPEADLLIDTMTVRPQGNRAFLISDTIRRLKAAGIWSKLDVFWMLAAHDAQAGRLNWKSPGTYTCSEVNSPTFTADRGFTGNGTTSYLTTGFQPATHSTNITASRTHAMNWSRDTYSSTGDRSDMGGYGGAGDNYGVLMRRSGSSKQFWAHRNGVTTTSADTAAGMQLGVRYADNSSAIYVNGLSVATGSNVPSTVTNREIYICCVSLDGVAAQFTTRQQAAISLGGDLSAAEAAAYYSIAQTYMNGVGA
jgi:hypothetical protein